MILIVDDDKTVRLSLRLVLERNGYKALPVATPAEALEAVRAGGVSLAIMDMNFSNVTTGDEGLHLLRQFRILDPEIPVILITGWGSIPLAVEGIKAGAFDFITKPWDNAHLLSRIETALRLTDKTPHAESDGEGFDRCGIIGSSSAMQEVLATVERVASTDAPVLILGENGTGKEMVARAIHRNSRRASRSLVTVNLGGLSRTLFESEMFGHVKGAFTGAVENRIGRVELADGGTLFLDEIGDLDPTSQVKLLRVLQEHSFEALGDSRTRKADIRVVCATNADLPAMVAAGTFREDLFYRINLITLRLPPLRERREDIPALARHFVEEAAEAQGIRVKKIAPDAISVLQSLPFPGNIRELRNVVTRALIISDSDEIHASDISTPGESGKQDNATPDSTLVSMEKEAIIAALEKYKGNLSSVAVALGLSRQALYRRMDKYGLR